MQSIDNQSVFVPADPVAEFSGRWLARRVALWILFVALGVTGSCLLYNMASSAEADGPAAAQTATLSRH